MFGFMGTLSRRFRERGITLIPRETAIRVE